MKIRLAAALTLVGALFLSMSGADAATPTMDGKKVKVLTMTGSGGLQDHDKDFVADEGERVECSPPRCAKLKFVYKPAKGVKGGLLLTATWSKPVSDMDLYLAVLDKRGNPSQVGNCGGSASTQEKVYVPSASLHSGSTYVMVVDYYRSINENMSAKVEINVPNPIKTTVPQKVDEVGFLNCSLVP